MFDLKRPCVNCPFRIGQGSRFQLQPDRLREILRAVAFQCHKTVDYTAEEDAEGDEITRAGDHPEQCAGLMALLHRAKMHNQMMQVAERLGALDPATLDPLGEAYQSVLAAFRAHLRCVEPRQAAAETGAGTGR